MKNWIKKSKVAVLLLSALVSQLALGVDQSGPRNRSNGGIQCIQTNVSGAMTNDACFSGLGVQTNSITNLAGTGAPSFPFGATGITATVPGTPEKNYILTAGQTTATGWTASGAGVTVTTSSTAADLPRPNTDTTGIKFTGVSGSTAYAYYRFTLDPADYGKQLKVQFDQNATLGVASAYASGDFKVDVYQNTLANYTGTSTRLSLSPSDGTSAVSPLVNQTGTFRTSFGAGNATAPYIELRIGLNSTNTHSIVLSDVIVGPGSVVQSAYVGPAIAWTPTGTWTTNTTYTGQYWRTGNRGLYYVKIGPLTGTPATGSLSVNMPSGQTIDSSIIDVQNIKNTLGRLQATAAGAATTGQVLSGSTTSVDLLYQNTTAGSQNRIQPTAPAAFGGGDIIELWWEVPVAEWAGSGTVNLIGNDGAYASNSNSTNTASDLISFQYGPSGALMPNGATGTAYTRRIRFPYPVIGTPEIEVQNNSTSQWVKMNGRLGSYIAQNTNGYGIQVIEVSGSSTDFDVIFQSGGWASSGATYGANGAAFSTIATWHWRAVAPNPGTATGFAAYAPGVSSGLVPSAGLPGNTTGATPCSGCVGQIIRSTTSGTGGVAGASTQLTTITLTPGTWNLYYSAILSATSGLTGGVVALNTVANSESGTVNGYDLMFMIASATQTSGISGVPILAVVPAGSTQPYYLNIRTVGAGSVIEYGSIIAQRIF